MSKGPQVSLLFSAFFRGSQSLRMNIYTKQLKTSIIRGTKWLIHDVLYSVRNLAVLRVI